MLEYLLGMEGPCLLHESYPVCGLHCSVEADEAPDREERQLCVAKAHIDIESFLWANEKQFLGMYPEHQGEMFYALF